MLADKVSLGVGSNWREITVLITDVLAWSAQNPDDWTKTWKLLEEKWDKRDACPAGALLPFNIDAKLNGAYIALGLPMARVSSIKP